MTGGASAARYMLLAYGVLPSVYLKRSAGCRSLTTSFQDHQFPSLGGCAAHGSVFPSSKGESPPDCAVQFGVKDAKGMRKEKGLCR